MTDDKTAYRAAPTWTDWVAAHPAETPQEIHLRHARWTQLHREELADKAAAAEASVADVPGIDLIMRLVAYIDRRHESDSHDCHPRVPDDCAPYCGACEVLRPVTDPVLRAVRARWEASNA